MLKVKGWIKIFHACENQKRVEIAIFISDKIDFSQNGKKRQDHYIMIKGSFHQEDITIINCMCPTLKHLNILNKY